MKKYIFGSIVLIGFLFAFIWDIGKNTEDSETKNYIRKVYTSNDYTVTVLDPESQKIIKEIDLGERIYSKRVQYTGHNIQLSPDKTLLAVSANVMDTGTMGGKGEKSYNDIIILIDPQTDTIRDRIPVGDEKHLGHVVFDAEGKKLYVNSGEEHAIYEIDIQSKKILRKIPLFVGATPHGLRFDTPTNSLFVATEGYILQINIADASLKYIPVYDKAVQIALSGNKVYATLYGTKKIAVYDISTQSVEYISLPAGAKGPIQLFVDEKRKHLYVADQGYYFGQASNNMVYRIDITSKDIRSFRTQDGTHGIIGDENFVYASNLLSGTVSIFDIQQEKIIGNVSVGESPNGIAVWEK